MTDRIAVYTAVTAGYGTIGPHPEVEGIDWIAFVDDATVAAGWEFRPIKVPSGSDPRRVAKTVKLRPDLFLPEYERTLWIDATVQVTSPAAVHHALLLAESSGIALYPHPERMCIYPEAVVSLGMPKYADEPILNQVAHYWDLGHPVNAGLWACGILARVNTSEVRDLMELWQEEIERWSVQDQLSFPYVLRATGFQPGELTGSLYGNPWFTVTGHNPLR